jgi:hypothetical protein
VDPVQPRTVRCRSAALGVLALVATTGACSRDVEVLEQAEGAGATLGRGDTGGAAGGGATGRANAGMGGASNPVMCGGPRSELTIDGMHWTSGECNDYEIQGGWHCITDEIADEDCDHTTRLPRYDDEVMGYCLSGTTIVDFEFKAWGASLGLELNNDGVGKVGYDASAHGIVGFAVTVEGITSGNPLRIAFTPSATGIDTAPFVEYPSIENETRTLTAYIEDASVPAEWDVPSAGERADPTSIVDVELQVVGSRREAPFQFCITQVVPLVSK